MPKALLAASPAALITHKDLDRALRSMDEEYKLKPGQLTRQQWSCAAATQLRVALARLLKLKNVPRLWQQRARELPNHGASVL